MGFALRTCTAWVVGLVVLGSGAAALAQGAAIGGRLVDADSGEPLVGLESPYASVSLWRCTEDGCFEFLAQMSPFADGRFLFTADDQGLPLDEATYQLHTYAYAYDDFVSAPFAVAAGESVDVGDLRLERWRFVGSISGRLVDALDGRPVSSGDPSSYSFVTAIACDGGNCSYGGYAVPDAEGRFTIAGSDQFLRAGTYHLEAWANQYVTATSEAFAIGEGEDFDFGDVDLEPYPVQLGAVEACDVPAEGGGVCRFSFELENRLSAPFSGETWSQVWVSGTGSLAGATAFQVGQRGPSPIRLELAPGESIRVELGFDVPATVPSGAYFCATALIGQDPDATFNVLGYHGLFCVGSGGGFVDPGGGGGGGSGGDGAVSPGAAGRELLRRLQQEISSRGLKPGPGAKP